MASLEKILQRDIEDLKQILQEFLVPIYKERLRRFIKDKGEMIEADCYTTLPIKRQDWRQAEGDINSFSRWLWYTAFFEMKSEGELVTHHHGKGHVNTYTLKEEAQS